MRARAPRTQTVGEVLVGAGVESRDPFSSESRAVRMRIGVEIPRFLRSLHTSIPSRSGRSQSSTITSSRLDARHLIAGSPE